MTDKWKSSLSATAPQVAYDGKVIGKPGYREIYLATDRIRTSHTRSDMEIRILTSKWSSTRHEFLPMYDKYLYRAELRNAMQPVYDAEASGVFTEIEVVIDAVAEVE